MKNTITTLLTAICVSGLLLSAAAQPTATPDDNNTAATPDQPAPTPDAADTGNGGGPDAGATAPAMDAQPDQTATNQADAAQAQPAGAAQAENQPVTSTVIVPKGNAPETVASGFVPPAQTIGTNSNDLNLNFNNAPLDMVLNYLSDAAGFIIVQQTRVSGVVTITGKHLTQDEAVNLLNSELNRNNYAAIREGRTLTIVSKSDAKTSRIPVKTGNNPDNIPNNDEIATWIIPIRFVEARQLVSDLSLFVSAQATIVANEAGNSIVVTDTQANIRHLAEIIQAIDNSAEAETEIRVFRLQHASPTDVATELSSIFPSSSSSGNQAPIQFGGGRGTVGRGGGGFGSGGFGGGGFGGGGFGGGRGGGLAALLGGGTGTTASSSQQRIQKATQVSAVADSRIQAVIVTAPKDLMEQIAGIMTELDVTSDRDQDVSVIALQNGDPQQVAQVLQNMFGSGTTSRSGSSSQNSALQQRAQNSTTTMGTTTTSSGIGGSGYGGGGGRGGGGGGF
jgi:type II secretory pathway component GspD/PulD (secretin)